MYENFGNFLLIIFTMKISSFTIKKPIWGQVWESRVRRRFRESRVRQHDGTRHDTIRQGLPIKSRRRASIWHGCLQLGRHPTRQMAAESPNFDWRRQPDLAPSHSRGQAPPSHSRFPFPAENRFIVKLEIFIVKMIRRKFPKFSYM